MSDKALGTGLFSLPFTKYHYQPIKQLHVRKERSKSIRALLGEGYTSSVFEREEIEIELEPGKRGQARFLAIPLEVVAAYWQWQSHRGNKKALALCMALITESLERRFDRAFNMSRSEEEYDDRLTQRIQQLESDLERLGDSYAGDDIVRQERDYFERLLRENGIEPYS